MKWKLTKQERNWVLYDVGNSAFTLLIATILPIYFNYLADKGGLSDVEYLAYWGYAASVVTLLVALLGPVIGTLADTEGYKKPIFIAFIVVGIIACVSLGITGPFYGSGNGDCFCYYQRLVAFIFSAASENLQTEILHKKEKECGCRQL